MIVFVLTDLGTTALKALGGFHLALYLLRPTLFMYLFYPIKVAFLMQWSKPSHRAPFHTCLALPLVYEEKTTVSRESEDLLGQKLAIFYKNSGSQSLVWGLPASESPRNSFKKSESDSQIDLQRVNFRVSTDIVTWVKGRPFTAS